MKDLTFNGEFPVACFSSLQLSDIDEIYEQFNRIIRKHDVLTYEVTGSLSELHYAPLSKMAISGARLGTKLLVDAHAVEDTCLIFCASDNPFHMTIDGRSVLVDENKTGVVMPGMPFQLTVPPDSSSIMLDLDLSYVESLIAHELNDELEAPLQFLHDDLYPADEKGFIDLLHLLYKQVELGIPEIGHRGHMIRFEELVASSFIYGKRHNYSNALDLIDSQVAPRYVERAVTYIHEHAGEALTLKTLAEIATISQRSLVRGFQKYKDCSPMAYLKKVRLEKAHQELKHACPENTSVTSIAGKWGFHNAGRFAHAYRNTFHESPSDTLRKKLL